MASAKTSTKPKPKPTVKKAPSNDRLEALIAKITAATNKWGIHNGYIKDPKAPVTENSNKALKVAELVDSGVFGGHNQKVIAFAEAILGEKIPSKNNKAMYFRSTDKGHLGTDNLIAIVSVVGNQNFGCRVNIQGADDVPFLVITTQPNFLIGIAKDSNGKSVIQTNIGNEVARWRLANAEEIRELAQLYIDNPIASI